MPGKRQPTDVVLANGRKHLSRAEEAQRRAGEVKLPQAETARPPGWLPKELKKTFRTLGKQLIQAKLYTELDADTLGRYVAAQHQWELATGHVEEALEWRPPTRRRRTAGAGYRTAISNRPGPAPMTWG